MIQLFGNCRYQLEGVKKALQANSILYLETGAGKTLVAVLLIKSLARNLRLKDEKRIAVFLVPKVILVHQVVINCLSCCRLIQSSEA